MIDICTPSNRDVLVITPKLDQGGAERMTVQYAEEFGAAGANVTIYVLGKPMADCQKYDAEVYTIHNGYSSNRFIMVLRLWWYIAWKNPDIVFTSLVRTAIVVAIQRIIFVGITRFYFVIRVENRFSVQQKYQSFGMIFRVFRKIAYGNADRLICQTKVMEKELVSEIGALKKKTRVIYNWTNVKGQVKNHKENKSQYTVGFVGRLSTQKNFGLALETFCSLLRKQSDCRLVVAGDGPLRDQYEEYTKELGVDSAVSFLGYVSDIEDVYGEINCLLITSHYEGASNALIEAMLSGVPVVTVEASGEEWRYVAPGVSGYICTHVPDELSGCLKSVFQELAHGPWDHVLDILNSDYQQAKVEIREMLYCVVD